MPWVVTLHVTDCTSHANIAGASVSAPDIVVIQPTDANGDWIFEELDDSIQGEIVQISKLGYISKNFEIDKSQQGKTLEVCLNPSPHGTTDPNQPTGRGDSCFTGDTRIALADGSETPISLIREGDYVLGRTGQLNRVIGIERPLLGTRPLYALNECIPFVTAEHPFLTESGWKAIDPEATSAENPSLVVGRLAPNDVLLSLRGCAVPAGSIFGESVEVDLESISLVSLKPRHADPATPLYNLLLEGDHAYFANRLLVHNKGCFIVSATTGSAQSQEVLLLRELRNRIGRVSPLSAKLIETIYSEYYQFSPGIAAELERDTIARKAVLLVIVRPLLAWYTLAGKLAFEYTDKEAIRRASQDVLSSCSVSLGGAASILELIAAIRLGAAFPANTPPLLLAFAPRIREAARFRFASWAILDPLVRVWRSATDHLDLVEQVAGWLADAPLEALDPPSVPDMLPTELGGLAGFFDFEPTARRRLAERLTTAWPGSAGGLKRAGFGSQAPSRKQEEQ